MRTLSDGIHRKQSQCHHGSPHTGGRPFQPFTEAFESLSRNRLSQADGNALHHVAQRLVSRIDRIATRQQGQQAACPSQNRPLPESFDAALSGAVGPVALTLPLSGDVVGGRRQQRATRGCCTRHLLLKSGETFANRKMMAYQVMKVKRFPAGRGCTMQAASNNPSVACYTACARDIGHPDNEDSVHALKAAFDLSVTQARHGWRFVLRAPRTKRRGP